ncbi:hypothetical protein BH780_gp223 [Bacillus phage Eldridge]|uniref:Uncharacterized protein n=1 Tax=Bacillus phage Eldridge TaxID=1776293 RepID=A0A109ZVU9_9CAUD|nr:hypothetical protein BH780_gp223 [Bacillus phage Eldridge]AMB18806.1 hypothetical protein Eldridge_0226 [Bacillus phage Eldridge]
MEPFEIVKLLKKVDVDPNIHSVLTLDYLTGIDSLDRGNQPTEEEWYAMGLIEGLIEGGDK